MLVTKLSGGLGNSMFIYAAVRSIAERNGFNFCYFSIRRWHKKKIRSLFRSFFAGSSEDNNKQVIQGDLCQYFTLNGDGDLQRFVNRVRWLIQPKFNKSKFTQELQQSSDGVLFAKLCLEAGNVDDWTMLSGAFQSELYFRENRLQILQWFQLRGYYQKIADRIEAQINATPDMRCCIHIRRGDYLVQNKGLSWGSTGWVLPDVYYEHAIAKLPEGVFLIFSTDDPEYVEATYKGYEHKLILKETPEPIDQYMFTRCKYNIIANSTYSWWGAWLNQQPEKKIFAPKYHLGWWKKEWLPPEHSVHPDDWEYIDVPTLLDRRSS